METKTEDQIYSKTVKTNRVEKFEWHYEDLLNDPVTGKPKQTRIDIENIQAIYINPKWMKSKVGAFLTRDQPKPQKQKKEGDSSSDDEEFKKQTQS